MKNIFLGLFFAFNLTEIYACTCEGFPLEKVALGKVNLVYIEIKKPSFVEKIKSFTEDNKSKGGIRLNIKVLKNYAGNYNYQYIYGVNNKSKYDCGVDFRGGERILVSYRNENYIPLVNSCNILYEKDLSKIDGILQRYKESLAHQKNNYVNWDLIENGKEYDTYAGLADYEKTQDLQTIWTLTNLKQHEAKFIDMEPHKSYKAEITISCKHRKFNIRSIYYFTEPNGFGNIVEFSNYAENNLYNWKEIVKGYPLHKLMKMVCK